MIKRERELAVGLMIAMDEIGMVGVLGGFGILRIALYGLYGGDGGEFVRGRSAGPAVVGALPSASATSGITRWPLGAKLWGNSTNGDVGETKLPTWPRNLTYTNA